MGDPTIDRVRTALPELVPAGATAFVWECEQCAREKTNGVNGRSWGWGEGRDDVRHVGELGAADDDGWIACPYGHRVHVVREGTRAARSFRSIRS